ncbi:LuxR C-terminal-related transcriptional regulator [Dermatobacter hominis]|uniref:LuxR C-terminal-related transcriptional regulator n=1 Tax=Dermatobacter hominis TaxID=2884263 RepID=UPI001D10D295|nr:LuxR C-terminal-related transcriptional regulator [Dermatobacter hominis]UDY34979.1 LuxR C-terminal-related transcriptional regulator [Dermatobacter hominis]
MHEPGSHRDAHVPAWPALIGRDEAVEHVGRLVRRPDVRLVTVTGRSGVGKSALASAVARVITAEDGLGIVRAQVDRHTPTSGAEELRAALSLATDGPAGPVPTGRRRVVLLDGVEAVAEAARLVAGALADDEGLTVLATSIVPLSLPDEHEVVLPMLRVPGPDDDTVDAQRDAPAVLLLLTRIAEATGRGDHPLDDVVALARLLDGLPLALELAAARCADLTVGEVRRQVEMLTPVGALLGGADPAVAHHRDLRSTILWTYELLDDEHREALRRLGVFAGSFDRRGVAAVTRHPAECLDVLVTTGLARASAPRSDVERFELVPSVSLVARELLAAEGDLAATEERHAAHLLATAAAAAPELRSARTPEVRRRLLGDLDDIAAAALHLGRAGRREDALRMVVDVALLWEESSAAALAARLLGELLPGPTEDAGVDERVLAEAWALTSNVAVWGQRPVERRADIDEGLDRAVELARAERTPSTLLVTLRSRVPWDLLVGRPEVAAVSAEEGLALARGAKDPWWECQFLGLAAAATVMAGDTRRARELAVEGRDLALLEGDTAQLLRLSHILLGTGGVEASAVPAPMTEEELVVLARRVGDPHAEGMLQVGAAVRGAFAGELSIAAEHLHLALDVGRRHGLWYIEELALVATVLVATLAGRADDAARLHGGLHDVLPGLERGIPPETMQLYGFALDRARAVVGDAAFDAAVARGRLLDWEEATSLAAALCDEVRVGPEVVAPADAPLTARQVSVTELMATGRTNKEIAAELGLRPKTVMHHTSEIYRRLGVRNRTEAVAEARRLGLLRPSP